MIPLWFSLAITVAIAITSLIAFAQQVWLIVIVAALLLTAVVLGLAPERTHR